MEKKCKVWKAFLEDLNDDELQKRYDRFVANVRIMTKDFNLSVNEINKKISKLHVIEKIILDLAIKGTVKDELIEKRNNLFFEIEKMGSQIAEKLILVEKEEKLAHQYKETSEHRFFVWFKVLNAVSHPEAKSYPMFKQKWGGKII